MITLSIRKKSITLTWETCFCLVSIDSFFWSLMNHILMKPSLESSSFCIFFNYMPVLLKFEIEHFTSLIYFIICGRVLWFSLYFTFGTEITVTFCHCFGPALHASPFPVPVVLVRLPWFRLQISSDRPGLASSIIPFSFFPILLTEWFF